MMRWYAPVAMLWASPCSAIGLVVAAAVLATGGRARWSRGALEVTWRQCHAQCGSLARSASYRGFVMGHVILMITEEDLAAFGAHERVHVAQYGRWGPFFLPAYGLSSLWQLIRGRRPYWDNRFEIEAREREALYARAP